VKNLSTTDKLYKIIFSEISLGVVIPILIGVLILAFPTVIEDFLATIHISFPEAIWGGPEIPLQHILTIGTAEAILTGGIPAVLGLIKGKWAGGSAGFICSILFVLSMAAYYMPSGYFYATADWLGVIVSGMLMGYITGALMEYFIKRGSTGFKWMLLAAVVGAIVATIFTTQTYIWFAPMFNMGIGEGPGMLTYWDAVGLAYFTYAAIYGVWALLGVIAAKVAYWYGIMPGMQS
jgi:hypothetical protein